MAAWEMVARWRSSQGQLAGAAAARPSTDPTPLLVLFAFAKWGEQK